MKASVTTLDVTRLEQQNHYDRLEVEATADTVALKRAYRIACRRYPHPTPTPSPPAFIFFPTPWHFLYFCLSGQCQCAIKSFPLTGIEQSSPVQSAKVFTKPSAHCPCPETCADNPTISAVITIPRIIVGSTVLTVLIGFLPRMWWGAVLPLGFHLYREGTCMPIPGRPACPILLPHSGVRVRSTQHRETSGLAISDGSIRSLRAVRGWLVGWLVADLVGCKKETLKLPQKPDTNPPGSPFCASDSTRTKHESRTWRMQQPACRW
jgi:hypothetical protein